MSVDEIKQRQAHFKEFGEILVRRHGQNYYSSYHNQNRVTADETAIRFGRYLRAARSNAGLSIKELARHGRISEATLTALEHGLILACDIKPRWLKRLAQALAENTDDFNLLLGHNIVNSNSNSRWFAERLATQWQNWLNYSKASLLSKPVYGTVSAILLCFAVSTYLFFGTDFFKQQPPQQKANSSIIVGPEHRLNLVKAEPGLESQAFTDSTRSLSLPIQAHGSPGIARGY